MATQKEMANETVRLYRLGNGKLRQTWLENSQRGYDFYNNDQLEAELIEQLENAGMPTFIINRVTPVIELMRYFATAQSPRWNAVGAEGSDIDIAHMYSAIIDYDWHNSNGKSVYGQVILDALTRGIGYFMVDVDPDLDYGRGEIVFRRIPPQDFVIDPRSTDFLFRDAGWAVLRKIFTRDSLKNELPKYKTKINKAQPSDPTQMSYSKRDMTTSESIQEEDIFDAYDVTGEETDLLDYYERYQKIRVPYKLVILRQPFTEAELEEINRRLEVAMKEFGKEVAVEVEERKAEIQEQLSQGEIIEERAELEIERAEKMVQEALQLKRQEMTAKIQEELTKTETSAISVKEFDLMMESDPDFAKMVVDTADFFETKIERIRTVGDTFLDREVLNTGHYPFVPIPYNHTGTPYSMSAVTPLVGKQQEINRAHQIMIHNANLSSNLRWLYLEGSINPDTWEQYSSSAGALLPWNKIGDGEKPEAIHPLPLNNAFYSITQEGKADMEYISGMHSSMQGDVATQHDTFKGLLAQDEFGTRRIRAWMENIVEPALQQLGEVHKDMSQDVYDRHKVFRIVQPDMDKVKEAEINIPIYNDQGDVINRWNDYASAKFDIKIVPGATMPINRWALLNEYYRWFEAGIIDDIAFLSKADVDGKENLIKRKSLYAQLQNKIQQMEETVKDKEGTIETLSRQVIQANIRDESRKVERRMDASTLQSEYEAKYLRDSMREEIKSEIQKIVSQLEAESEIMRQQIRQQETGARNEANESGEKKT